MYHDKLYVFISSENRPGVLGLMYEYQQDSLVEMFTPSIPQIAKDLNSTGSVVK